MHRFRLQAKYAGLPKSAARSFSYRTSQPGRQPMAGVPHKEIVAPSDYSVNRPVFFLATTNVCFPMRNWMGGNFRYSRISSGEAGIFELAVYGRKRTFWYSRVKFVRYNASNRLLSVMGRV